MAATSSMCSSKSPSVDGFVSIRPAVLSSTSSRRCATSTLPRASVWTLASLYPAIVTLAGFVPCAVSAVTIVSTLSLPAIGEVRAHQHQPRQLALRAGGRLERARVQPRDLDQRLLQAPHQLERALAAVLVLVGMEVAKAGEHHEPLVDARVVLHRAGAERVEARVDAEVPGRELGEVPEDLGLCELRQPRRRLPAQLFRNLRGRDVRLRQLAAATAGLRLLEDQLHACASASASLSMSVVERRSVTATSSTSSSPG